jgi:tetratricopeptide (TPR) repeat protein
MKHERTKQKVNGSEVMNKNENDQEADALTPEEMDEITGHVRKYITNFQNVIHEKTSKLVHLDLIPLEPNEHRPFHTFVTMGMSSRPMQTPWGEDVFVELVIFLPKDWKVAPKEWKSMNNFWPINLLINSARYPFEHDTFLDIDHTISHGDPIDYYADNTRFCCVLIDEVNILPKEFSMLKTKDKVIHFWCLVPIYKEELAYGKNFGNRSLAQLMSYKMGNEYQVVDIHRNNAVVFTPRLEKATINDLFLNAFILGERKQYAKAIQMLDEIIRISNDKPINLEVLNTIITPHDNLLWSGKAALYYEMKRYSDCISTIWQMIEDGNYAGEEDIYLIIEAYDRLIEKDPKNIDLYIKKAQAAYWTRLGCSPHPVESLEKILEIDDRNIKRFPEIIDEFEELRKDDPNDMILIEALMYLQHKVDNHKKILEYLTKYVEDDDFREVGFDNYTVIVDAFIAEKRFDEGLEFCDKLLESASDDDNFLDVSEKDIKALKEKIKNKMTEK